MLLATSSLLAAVLPLSGSEDCDASESKHSDEPPAERGHGRTDNAHYLIEVFRVGEQLGLVAEQRFLLEKRVRDVELAWTDLEVTGWPSRLVLSFCRELLQLQGHATSLAAELAGSLGNGKSNSLSSRSIELLKLLCESSRRAFSLLHGVFVVLGGDRAGSLLIQFLSGLFRETHAKLFSRDSSIVTHEDAKNVVFRLRMSDLLCLGEFDKVLQEFAIDRRKLQYLQKFNNHEEDANSPRLGLRRLFEFLDARVGLMARDLWYERRPDELQSLEFHFDRLAGFTKRFATASAAAYEFRQSPSPIESETLPGSISAPIEGFVVLLRQIEDRLGAVCAALMGFAEKCRLDEDRMLKSRWHRDFSAALVHVELVCEQAVSELTFRPGVAPAEAAEHYQHEAIVYQSVDGQHWIAHTIGTDVVGCGETVEQAIKDLDARLDGPAANSERGENASSFAGNLPAHIGVLLRYQRAKIESTLKARAELPRFRSHQLQILQDDYSAPPSDIGFLFAKQGGRVPPTANSQPNA